MPVPEDQPQPSIFDRAIDALTAEEVRARQTAGYVDALARVLLPHDGDIAYQPGTDPMGDWLRWLDDQERPQIEAHAEGAKERLLELLRRRGSEDVEPHTGEPQPDVIIGE